MKPGDHVRIIPDEFGARFTVVSVFLDGEVLTAEIRLVGYPKAVPVCRPASELEVIA